MESALMENLIGLVVQRKTVVVRGKTEFGPETAKPEMTVPSVVVT